MKPSRKLSIPERACQECSRRFTPTRMWHVFCSPSCRVAGQAEARSAEYACEYCGLSADGLDHVPPQSVRPKLIELGLASRYPFVEVRACHECNSAILGCLAIWTITARKAYVKKRLEHRYRKFLAIPDWTEDDLTALSRELESFTRHGLAVRDVTRARLDW